MVLCQQCFENKLENVFFHETVVCLSLRCVDPGNICDNDDSQEEAMENLRRKIYVLDSFPPLVILSLPLRSLRAFPTGISVVCGF